MTSQGLGEDLRHTFTRRGTALPEALPDGLAAAFVEDAAKQAQWAGFVRKSKLEAPSLREVVETVATLAGSAFKKARSGT